MTTKIQKEKERSQFYEFKALYSGFPEGEIDDNSENPDFLIKTDNGVIGIEHVAYIREQKLGQKSGGSRLRKEENVANQFVQVAQNYFDSKISDPLIVDFSWYGNKEINKRDANILA